MDTTRESKGRSPFYPGQPVPSELFVGRDAQIKHIMTRGVGQVSEGKPVAMYVEGEYGIGKSSVAGFVQEAAEREHGLHGIYVSLSGVESLDDLGAAVLRATVESGAYDLTREGEIRDWLAKYIGEQTFFGVTVRLDALKEDAPNIAPGLLAFLAEACARLETTGVKGVFLIFDEINGLAADPKFAHFVKGLVDTNAMSRQPVPVLLMLCGVEACRREMIRNHQPVERIFDVVHIDTLSPPEMADFFRRAFTRVGVEVEESALDAMTHYSAGFPKIMHLVGDAAFWRDEDGVITQEEAFLAVLDAAEEVGRKYVDQQVYKALRSEDYHSILGKIGMTGLHMSFRKRDITSDLTETEKRKLDNFLQRMKKLGVLRSGDLRGEYVFNNRMVGLYLWLRSRREGAHGQ